MRVAAARRADAGAADALGRRGRRLSRRAAAAGGRRSGAPRWPHRRGQRRFRRCAAGLPRRRGGGMGDATRWQRLARSRRWQRAREAAGFVRRAHGDLHLGNLCLWQGRPVPFDALEFDEALARIDLGYDLAFLLMDLERRVGRAAANLVLNRYVARTGDAGLVARPAGLPVDARDGARACRRAPRQTMPRRAPISMRPRPICVRRRRCWSASAACRAPANRRSPARWRRRSARARCAGAAQRRNPQAPVRCGARGTLPPQRLCRRCRPHGVRDADRERRRRRRGGSRGGCRCNLPRPRPPRAPCRTPPRGAKRSLRRPVAACAVAVLEPASPRARAMRPMPPSRCCARPTRRIRIRRATGSRSTRPIARRRWRRPGRRYPEG